MFNLPLTKSWQNARPPDTAELRSKAILLVWDPGPALADAGPNARPRRGPLWAVIL